MSVGSPSNATTNALKLGGPALYGTYAVVDFNKDSAPPAKDFHAKYEAAYKASVLTKGIPRVAVEAGVSDFWYKYVGLEGAVVGIDTFGESAPAGALFKYFGFTPEKVVEAVRVVLA